MLSLAKSSAQQYIDLAIDLHSPQDHNDMLTIIDFIKATEYDINHLYIDKFWASLRDNQLIYVDDELIKWMGFDAAQSRDRKMCFINLMKSNDINYTELSNEKYSQLVVREHARTILYPVVPSGKGTGTLKHILLDVNSLKYAMMMVGRGKGKHVKEYYLALENLIQIYTQYQSTFKEYQSAIQREENIKLLATKDQQIQEKDKRLIAEITEKEEIIAKCERIGQINNELIIHKQFTTREQILYVGATMAQAEQGLFKVSKTRDIKARNSTHNTTHPIGDEFIIFHQIKTNNALHLEQRAKHVLQHVRPTTAREFYQIPYHKLIDILEKMEANVNDEEELINDVIVFMIEIRKSNNKIAWTEGLPVPLLAEAPHIPLLMGPNEQVREDIESIEDRGDIRPIETLLSVQMTELDIRALISKILNERAIDGVILQKDLHSQIKSQLPRGKKTKFRAGEWKVYYDNCAGGLNIRIRKGKK